MIRTFIGLRMTQKFIGLHMTQKFISLHMTQRFIGLHVFEKLVPILPPPASPASSATRQKGRWRHGRGTQQLLLAVNNGRQQVYDDPRHEGVNKVQQ